MHVYANHALHLILAYCSPSAKFIVVTLSAAGQATGGLSRLRCARLNPGRGPWQCFEHSESLSWLFLSRGCVLRMCCSWYMYTYQCFVSSECEFVFLTATNSKGEGISGVLVRLTACKRLTNSLPKLSLINKDPSEIAEGGWCERCCPPNGHSC